MRVVLWNISYQNKVEKKLEFLKSQVQEYTLIVLLEVLPHDYEKLKDILSNDYILNYSLNLRKPSRFDNRSRKLGVLFIYSKDFNDIKYKVLERTPFPDRTGFTTLKLNNLNVSLFGLHSVTGVDYKKTKSVQYYSFAEAIEQYKPDFVCFDGNEPKIDHPNEEEIVFFSNRDDGKGVKTFFNEMKQNNLYDSYRIISKSQDIPLTPSFKLRNGTSRRYDYIFINTEKYKIKNVQYFYEKSIESGSDHAMIVCDVVPL